MGYVTATNKTRNPSHMWLQPNLNMQKWDHSMHCFFDLMAYVQARLTDS